MLSILNLFVDFIIVGKKSSFHTFVVPLFPSYVADFSISILSTHLVFFAQRHVFTKKSLIELELKAEKVTFYQINKSFPKLTKKNFTLLFRF